ncbi:ER membrane protein Wsc4, variant 4 [Trichophyton interdigitale]|uniref:ER membrane protein Wsc4, variant 4 n=1 Tax=Trichophyton interdigitale TaxID=101480 RepID=A0A9P4YHR2_9EURO|nr:ER membrane protein Wsc4, variant 4 [Trichophyton interdigitale]KAF3897855.1 ER membrane protein Wsc4, variant 4 [Trichophyton interdigitale]KAG8210168.1 ER membrane protein Wsc4, variant 4 [Trichophyton interdigitale]
MAPNPHGNLISLLFSLLILYPALAAAVDLDYCADFNTGSSFNFVVDGFQSIGACQKTCGDKYAFAVLQGKMCWCTNTAPKDTIPNAKCSQNCPGYPDDKCGNTSEGLFAYIMLDKKPSTTIGNPSSTTTSSSSTKTSKTTSSSPSTTTDPTASITTVEGRVTTITVPNAPVQTRPPAVDDSPSLSGGAIAGIIIGTLAVFAIFTGIILWLFCFRRRQQAKIDDSYRSPFHESPVPQPIFENTLSSRVPAMRVTPVANGNGTTAGSRGSTARLSIPAFTDHRMKKDALVYSHGGRHSNVSLQDNQDYSRPVLRLTNPDPDDR